MKKTIRSSWGEEEDSSIYSEGVRETLVDDDEIDSWEEAFMKGYDEAA